MINRDAFGKRIQVGSKIVHSLQGCSHRHRLMMGIVSKVDATSVSYTTINGRKHRAKRFDMVAVID